MIIFVICTLNLKMDDQFNRNIFQLQLHLFVHHKNIR